MARGCQPHISALFIPMPMRAGFIGGGADSALAAPAAPPYQGRR
jgi:hypothetical protein